MWMWDTAGIKECGPSLPWLLFSRIDVLRGAGRWTVKRQGYKKDQWQCRNEASVLQNQFPLHSVLFLHPLLFIVLSLLLSILWLRRHPPDHYPPFLSAVFCTSVPPSPVPSASLFWCLTFVASARFCHSHPFCSVLSILAIFFLPWPSSFRSLIITFLFPSAPFVSYSLIPCSCRLSPISCPAPVSPLSASAQP